MAGKKKGRKTHLIKQIREVIYDLGRPVTLHEILDHCTHLKHKPTSQRLTNILRKKEFVVTSHYTSRDATKVERLRSDWFDMELNRGSYKCNLYWVADTEGITAIPKCTVCGINIKMQRKGALRCSDCYKLMKGGERRNGNQKRKKK